MTTIKKVNETHYYRVLIPLVQWVDVWCERDKEMTKQELIDSVTDDEVVIPMYQNQLEYDSHNVGFVSELFWKGHKGGYDDGIEPRVLKTDKDNYDEVELTE